MMNQLSLLDLSPIEPEEMALPIVPQQPHHINVHAVAWHQARADFYLKLMGRFMNGQRCNPEVRRREISRLHHLREQAQQAIDRLERGI